ncbi:delta(9)-fatty-acid desaturase fat-7-like [Hyalella azteca]|uniref:Delta(9)-fatty-acid desaturase fat-7-like n=1 Tax=Hyalella azteca TaxID=294128 RepID=A0A8B7NK37_HYAAZ|nr:delta(9)-fatty-acid desaturase fat-7-like [Hyalella azteca]
MDNVAIINAEDFSTSTQQKSKNTRGIRDPIYVNGDHHSDHEDNHEHHHHHDEDDEYIYTFSLKQMYIDALNLDWSKVLWDMVVAIVVLHSGAVYGLFLTITGQIKVFSMIFTVLMAIISGLGVTMGVHRLWSHRSYKASLPVRLALMGLNCVAFQQSILIWSQDHRVHHKWSDTDRDLTNSRRGFFFAHMGWKMYKTHPEVIKGRKMVNIDDLLSDPVVLFQHKYFPWISVPLAFILPTIIPYYCWNEDLLFSFVTCGLLRLTITHHVTNCINSVAHLYGYKPYDKTLHAHDHNVLGPLALGEGWHNYHHAFPRDYRASEMDGWCFNLTTKIIETLAKFGLTYDLVTVSDDIINKRAARTGNPDERRHPRREVAGSAQPSPQ